MAPSTATSSKPASSRSRASRRGRRSQRSSGVGVAQPAGHCAYIGSRSNGLGGAEVTELVEVAGDAKRLVRLT